MLPLTVPQSIFKSIEKNDKQVYMGWEKAHNDFEKTSD